MRRLRVRAAAAAMATFGVVAGSVAGSTPSASASPLDGGPLLGSNPLSTLLDGGPLSAILRPGSASSALPRTYDPNGAYLNYADRSSIASGGNARLDSRGVVTVRHGSRYVYNPVTIAQYGLQEWSRYLSSGDGDQLHAAVVQAGWLVAHQHRATGTWTYHYDFAVGGMDETMHAPWSSAMAQGQAMSLLTRIATHYPGHPAYLKAARLATRPLWKPVRQGGLVDSFKGHPIYEEYPTTPPSFALNGFQFTLLGLHDLARTGFGDAQRLFDRGFRSMVFALPYYDDKTTTAYHLGYLTKPPRPVWSADRYHRIHVELLGVLYTIRPNATVKYWHDRWATYPPMRDGQQSGSQGGLLPNPILPGG